MADADLKVGDYTIAALSTQTFTFWWPHGGESRDAREHREYFDVSIAPKYDGAHSTIKPLVEVQRVMGYEHTAGTVDPMLNIMYVTLRNDNDFPVAFLANHVRVKQ